MNIQFNIKEDPLDPDLFDGISRRIAESFVREVEDEYTRKKKRLGVGKTQIRRLYDEVKRFEQKLDGTEKTWKEQQPYFNMIKSKLSYNIARAKEKAKDPTTAAGYKNLSDFIESGVKQVQADSEKYYHVFAILFEAVYGFYYENAPKEN